MPSTQSKAAQIVARAKNQQVRHRNSVRQFESTVVRKAAVSLTAAAYGTMNRYAVPPTVGGFPWKLGVWLTSTLVEALSSSRMVTAFAAGVSDGTGAIYIERAISNKTLVAGEDDEAVELYEEETVSGGEI